MMIFKSDNYNYSLKMLIFKDILVREDANQTRTRVMAATRGLGDKCASKGVGAKGEVTKEELAFMMEEVHR